MPKGCEAVTREQKARVRRRRERKIVKLYRKLAVKPDERLERRLRCLQQAEANEIWKAAQPSVDLARVDADLQRAKELIERLEQRAES